MTKTASLEALRHTVYADLITSLAPASVEQTHQFMANLRLPRKSIMKFLWLRVAPGMCQVSFPPVNGQAILKRLDEMYGSATDSIAGFYRDVNGRLRVNIPKACVLLPYGSRIGFFSGILCQPLAEKDKFWLLSSSKFGGPRAIRLRPEDAVLFETCR